MSCATQSGYLLLVELQVGGGKGAGCLVQGVMPQQPLPCSKGQGALAWPVVCLGHCADRCSVHALHIQGVTCNTVRAAGLLVGQVGDMATARI
jgi:hypothetical protein